MHDKSTARPGDGGVVGGSSGFSFKIRHISLTEATLSELETRIARVADQGFSADGATQAADWWAHRLDAFARAGAGAFRLMGLPGLPPSFLPALAEARRGAAALLAWTPGLD